MSAHYGPFSIDGISIPTPDQYKAGIQDLSSDKTGRTLDGVMHKDVVAVKDFYDCRCKGLSWEDAAVLLNAVDGKNQFTFVHADPRVPGRYISGTYYVGQRETSAMDLSDPYNAWVDIGFQITEV